MPSKSLGLVMIVRDEAANLKQSLEPVVSFFDEAVVVDTGSSDETASLAAAMGARVHHFAWVDDFSAARNYSIAMASADWLFWLDGDNAITPEDVKHLREHVPERGEAILWALEQVVPSGETLWQKRCFPRVEGVRFTGRVHEQLSHPAGWRTILTPVTVRHWGYADPEAVRRKALYYHELLARCLADDPDDFYAKFQAARCLLNMRRTRQASEILETVACDQRARRLNRPLWLSAHHLWAKALQDLGEADRAAGILNGLLTREPESGLCHLARGRLAYAQGDWALAAKHLQRFLDLGPGLALIDMNPVKNQVLANYFLGKSLERTGRADRAIEAMQRVLMLEPDNVAAATDLARLLLGVGRSDEARRYLQQILEQRPRDRAALRLLAGLDEAA